MARYWNALLFCIIALLERLRVAVTERHTSGVVPLQRRGLAENALVRESLFEPLSTQVLIPCIRELLVLLLQLEQGDVMVVDDGSRSLLDGDIVVSPVVRNQVRSCGLANLETHFRVPNGVAVLFAVVRDRQSGQTERAGLVHGL